MTENNEHRDLLEWLDEIDRGLRHVQRVLGIALACIVGLVIATVLGMM